jgi:hypothetical protein
MSKKRILVMVACSPIILAMLAAMILTACVGYAINGRWELREFIKQYKY